MGSETKEFEVHLYAAQVQTKDTSLHFSCTSFPQIRCPDLVSDYYITKKYNPKIAEVWNIKSNEVKHQFALSFDWVIGITRTRNKYLTSFNN